jgi:hypothetical protein
VGREIIFAAPLFQCGGGDEDRGCGAEVALANSLAEITQLDLNPLWADQVDASPELILTTTPGNELIRIFSVGDDPEVSNLRRQRWRLRRRFEAGQSNPGQTIHCVNVDDEVTHTRPGCPQFSSVVLLPRFPFRCLCRTASADRTATAGQRNPDAWGRLRRDYTATADLKMSADFPNGRRSRLRPEESFDVVLLQRKKIIIGILPNLLDPSTLDRENHPALSTFDRGND